MLKVRGGHKVRKSVLIPLVTLTTVALDLITKYAAANCIDPFRPIAVLPFFNLVNVHNTGAAFSMLRGMGNGFFIAIGLLAACFIIYLMLKSEESPFSLSLILGGAIGNMADRLYFGYVRDFIELHAGGFSWPAFNIADSALTVGLFLLLIDSFRKRQPRKQAD